MSSTSIIYTPFDFVIAFSYHGIHFFIIIKHVSFLKMWVVPIVSCQEKSIKYVKYQAAPLKTACYRLEPHYWPSFVTNFHSYVHPYYYMHHMIKAKVDCFLLRQTIWWWNELCSYSTLIVIQEQQITNFFFFIFGLRRRSYLFVNTLNLIINIHEIRSCTETHWLAK